MRIIVFSDTHGDSRAVNEIISRNRDAQAFIFLGDGERELNAAKEKYPDVKIFSVAGNCDYRSSLPDSGVYETDGAKIFYTHGHNWGVKFSMTRLFLQAKEIGANVALFGHTHCRSLAYEDGVYILNPGSASCPRDGGKPGYAFVDIAPNGIFCSHVDLTYPHA